MKNLLLLFLVFLFLSLNIVYVNPEDAVTEWTNQYDAVLKKYVKAGTKKGINLSLVNYKALSADKDFLVLYVQLENLPDVSLMDKNTQLAFWINVYNYLTLYIISKKPEINSIKDLGSPLKSVWKKTAGIVSGKKYTLDEIEHGIIRKQFIESRIHFAVVCASLSCPDLRIEAFRPGKLDDQLEDQLKNFLKNNKKGMFIDDKNKIIYLTKLFSWYGEDFGKNPKKYLHIKGYINSKEAEYKIKYLDYDWELNNQ